VQAFMCGDLKREERDMTMFTDEFVEGFEDLPKSEQKGCILKLTEDAAFQFQFMALMVATGRAEEADEAFNKGLGYLGDLKLLVEGNRVDYEAVAEKLMEMSGMTLEEESANARVN
jgi:hypothetical protein